MKKLALTLILSLTISIISNAQTTRYFKFTTACGHGNWQDGSFIAATSDQAVINDVDIKLMDIQSMVDLTLLR